MLNAIDILDYKIEVLSFYPDFLLLKSNQLESMVDVGQAIHQHRFAFIDEVIATEKEVCLKLNQHFEPKMLVELQQINLSEKTSKRIIKLPVLFTENEDWLKVEQHTKKSRTEIIKELLSLKIEVAMFGFLPGFAYLKNLPSDLHVPRKATPALRMEENTLAIGGPYLGIYTFPSPGGWYALGQTACPIFDVNHNPPMLLDYQDQIVIYEVAEEEYRFIKESQLNITDYNETS